MAWRIEENVLRGEIDNRVRGRVTARLWFCGHENTPMDILLQGDAEPDLHGRVITFTNPNAKPGDLQGLCMEQRGQAGHITASRKVRIPDVPLDRIGEYMGSGKKLPCHWGNVLYFEWFSKTNGRVVIEAAYKLVISPGTPTWRLTPEEKAERDAKLADAEKNSEFVTIIRNPNYVEPGDEWKSGGAGGTDSEAGAGEYKDGHFTDQFRPPTEEEADRDQVRSDVIGDRVDARMQREGADADYIKILFEEIDRYDREHGKPEPTPEEIAENERFIDDLNAAAGEELDDMKSEAWKGDAAPEAVMPEFEEEEERKRHPLVERAGDFALRVHRDIEARGWISEDMHHEHPVVQLRGSLMCVGPKLAGTMRREGDWPPPLFFTAHAIVRLKKALDYVEDALLAAESCAEQNLTEAAWLAEVARETREIGAEIEGHIAEQRARLGEG